MVLIRCASQPAISKPRALREGKTQTAQTPMKAPAHTRLAALQRHVCGTSPPSSSLEAAAAAPWPVEQSSVNIGIITERHGEHLEGFLGGFTVAEGVRTVSAADTTAGAQFSVVRAGLPVARLGSLVTDVESMLSQQRPQLTLVTAEAHNTAPLVCAALESGSHVLVEKPGCNNLSEFEALCDLAEKRGLQLMLAMAT